MAAASHATKAGTRVLINTSPEPFGVVAVNHPLVFLALLAVFLLLLVWLLPKLWRGNQTRVRGHRQVVR